MNIEHQELEIKIHKIHIWKIFNKMEFEYLRIQSAILQLIINTYILYYILPILINF